MQINQPHIEELLRAGKLFQVVVEVGAELEKSLDKLPWLGSGLDWMAMAEHRIVNRKGLSPEHQVEAIVRETHFADYDYAIAMFNAREPLIGGRRNAILGNLDIIFWKAPGTRFVFAAEKEDALLRPVTSTFFEYSGGDTLHFSR